MNINFVSRSDIKMAKRNPSKYDPLLENILKLKPGGKALEVTFEDDAELNAMRNAVYAFNREHNEDVKSSKHAQKKLVYFFKE